MDLARKDIGDMISYENKSVKIYLNNQSETCAFAEKIAKTLKPGQVIVLSGDLGVGKSVFARAMIRALGVTDDVLPSPTFALIHEYVCKKYSIAHMDWYRLKDTHEIEHLGVRDFFQPPWITIIEWPERAMELLPDNAYRISLSLSEKNINARVATY